MKALHILFLGLLFQFDGVAQSSETLVRQHITYLASDQLEGRAPGTKGEKLAQEYIIKAFKEYGLKPADYQQNRTDVESQPQTQALTFSRNKV